MFLIKEVMSASRISLMVCFLSLFVSHESFAGFSIGITRVIYNESNKGATVPISSNGDGIHYLVQGWVEDMNGGRADFMVTPPILKLGPDTQNTLSVKYLGEPLPIDRESLFYFNVKAIPAKDNSIGNQLTIANKNILKLIYRPVTLTFKDATDAPQKITLSRLKSKVAISNPTPFYINIGEFLINGKLQNDVSYVAPFSQLLIGQTISEEKMIIKYRTINDFGGASPYREISL